MLTDSKIRALELGSYRVADKQPGDNRAKVVGGFGVRVTPAGAKSFYLDYRVAGVGRVSLRYLLAKRSASGAAAGAAPPASDRIGGRAPRDRASTTGRLLRRG